MQTITLSELKKIKAESERKFFDLNQTKYLSQMQNQLQLLIQQKRLGLPIEPFLDNNYNYKNWIEELEDLFPSLFNPKKKVYLDVPLQAKLKLNDFENITIETNLHLGIAKNQLYLFDWLIRKPVITWEERVKLWIAKNYFQTNYQKIKMIVFIFSKNKAVHQMSVKWNRKNSLNIEQLIVRILTNSFTKTNSTPQKKSLININNIPEIYI